MRRRALTPFGIACQNLKRRRLRSICLTALVALLAFSLSAGSLLAVSLAKGINTLSDRLGADIMLVPYGTETAVEGALLRGSPSAFYFDDELAARLMETDGIDRASPQLFIASFDAGHCSFAVQLIGYDPETDFVIAPWLGAHLAGGLPDGEIVIGSDIESKPGGTLRFFAGSYPIAAQLEKTGMGFDTSVFFNMKTARAALKEYIYWGGKEIDDPEHAISVIAVDLDADTTASEFAVRIHDLFKGEGIEVISTKAMISDISKDLRSFLTIILALVAIVWILAVAVISIVFTVTLNERKREFGIYRALGATRKRLAYIIFNESSVIGIAGACIGIIVLCCLVFPFVPLINSSFDMPFLQPDGSAVVFLLAGSFAVSYLSVALASSYSSVRVGRLATHAIMKGDD